MLHQRRPRAAALIQRRWCLLSHGSASGVYLKGDLTEHSVTSSHLLFVPWSLAAWNTSLFQWFILFFVFWKSFFLFKFRFFSQSDVDFAVIKWRRYQLTRWLNILVSEDTPPPQRLAQLPEPIMSSTMFLRTWMSCLADSRLLVESRPPTQLDVFFFMMEGVTHTSEDQGLQLWVCLTARFC